MRETLLHMDQRLAQQQSIERWSPVQKAVRQNEFVADVKEANYQMLQEISNELQNGQHKILDAIQLQSFSGASGLVQLQKQRQFDPWLLVGAAAVGSMVGCGIISLLLRFP
jgi:hypothetical protein